MMDSFLILTTVANFQGLAFWHYRPFPCRWFAWRQWWKKRATEHVWWPSYTCLRHFSSALPWSMSLSSFAVLLNAPFANTFQSWVLMLWALPACETTNDNLRGANDEKRELLNMLDDQATLVWGTLQALCLLYCARQFTWWFTAFWSWVFCMCQFFPYTSNLGKAFCLVAMMKKSWYRNFIDDSKLVVFWATIWALWHCPFCPFLCQSVSSTTVANFSIRISHIVNLSPALVFGQLAWQWWDIVGVELHWNKNQCSEPLLQPCAACLFPFLYPCDLSPQCSYC
jgi:hypothetical protein